MTGRDQEEIGQYKFKLRQAETNVEELKTLLKDAQEKSERRYQAKRKEYKQKLESYKVIITQMSQERLETEEAVRRQEGEHASLHMERKMAALLK
jgi:chromosome segregation ATPase